MRDAVFDSFDRTVEPDAHSVFLQQLEIDFLGERATPQSHNHGPAGLDHSYALTDAVGFEFPEGLFPARVENVDDGAAFALDDIFVNVHEGPPEFLRQALAYRGLSASHESDQVDSGSSLELEDHPTKRRGGSEGDNGSMQPVLLPLFPLQVVLFPRTPLPLHIFEPRYREMIGEAIENKTEFGIVLAGSEGIAPLGCSAIVDRVVERYEDGRFDIAASGRRRFEIRSLDDERAFLRGRVEFFDDDDGTASEADRQELATLWREYSGFAGVEHEPRWDDPQLSFQVAYSITDLNFRQTLLGLRSEVKRVRKLLEFFPGYLDRQKHTQHIQMVAPRNGHGKHKVEE